MAASAAAPLGAAAPAEKPNILVIVMDDLGCRDLGYLGAKDLQTPNIDTFARNGVVFPNWYSNAPVCAPSRSAIISGRYPARAGVADNGGNLIPGIPCLGSQFKAAGYRTAAFGKWHLGSDDDTCPNGHGFDYFYGFHSGCEDFYSHRVYWGEPRRVNYHDLYRNRTEIFENGQYLTGRIAQEAVGFMNQSKGKPFCAYVAFNAVHYPMHVPDEYVRKFANLPFERRIYAAMLNAADEGIGKIRAALAANGQLENTLMFLVGDNGATTEKRAGLNQEYATAGSNGPFKGFKFSLFDGGMHVPGLIHWPKGVRGGRAIETPVQSMDILPTALAAAGLPQPDGMDGKPLLELLESGKAPHEALFWHQGGQTAVRRGAWKLVMDGKLYDRRPEGSKSLTGEDALWLSNLDEDPGESKNLRRLHPDLVDELATLASKWRETLPRRKP